jgi:DNA-directed RNA polymerase specialized sigma24 family protein
MRDTAVWGEDYFQEGLCLVLEKLKTWNPNKGTLTSYCWLDIRKRFRRLKYKTYVMECQLLDFPLDNLAFRDDSTEHQMTLNLFWSKLTPLQKQIVRKRLMGLTQEVIAKTLGLTLRTYKSEVRKIKKLGANS